MGKVQNLYNISEVGMCSRHYALKNQDNLYTFRGTLLFSMRLRTYVILRSEFSLMNQVEMQDHFFIVAPRILICVQFTHQQMQFFILKNSLKFTLKYT